MADVEILATQVSPAPLRYSIPGGQEILLKCLSAHFDGSGAGVAWQPAIQIVGPSGQVLRTFPTGSTVAIGGSADATWFPNVSGGVGGNSQGIRFNTDNEGGYLDVTINATDPQGLSGKVISSLYNEADPPSEGPFWFGWSPGVSQLDPGSLGGNPGDVTITPDSQANINIGGHQTSSQSLDDWNGLAVVPEITSLVFDYGLSGTPGGGTGPGWDLVSVGNISSGHKGIPAHHSRVLNIDLGQSNGIDYALWVSGSANQGIMKVTGDGSFEFNLAAGKTFIVRDHTGAALVTYTG